MKIDVALVERIAALAGLEFVEEEKERFAAQFAGIVAFVEQLAEVDTGGVEADDIHGRPGNVLLGDETGACLGRDEALANAPRSDDEFFLVPRVIADR